MVKLLCDPCEFESPRVCTTSGGLGGKEEVQRLRLAPRAWPGARRLRLLVHSSTQLRLNGDSDILLTVDVHSSNRIAHDTHITSAFHSSISSVARIQYDI